MNHIVSVVTEQIHEMNSIQTKQLEDMSDSEGCKDTNAVLKNQLLQLVAVMQHGGKSRGFNRKIQIRTLKWNPLGKEEVIEPLIRSEGSTQNTPSPQLLPIFNFHQNEVIDKTLLSRKSCSCSSPEMSRSASPSLVLPQALYSINSPLTSSLGCCFYEPPQRFELRNGVERVIVFCCG